MDNKMQEANDLTQPIKATAGVSFFISCYPIEEEVVLYMDSSSYTQMAAARLLVSL